jgi:hypothetical protein
MRELLVAFAVLAGAAAVTLRPRTEPWRDAERATEMDHGQRIPLRTGARLGEVALTGAWSDFRGQTIAPGRYELRYALQPRSKHHAGADAVRDFALLVPRALGEAGDWVAASRRVSRTAPPAGMALEPGPERDRRGVVYRRVGDLTIGFVVSGRAASEGDGI